MSAAEPHLRPARRADLPAILAMLADDILGRDRETGDRAAAEAAFATIEADPRSTVYVLDLDGAAIGCGQLTTFPGLARGGLVRGLIEAVRIAAPHRGRGLGATLIRGLIAEAKAAGCGLVQLTSDKRRADAHRFYLSLGFAMSHDGFKLAL